MRRTVNLRATYGGIALSPDFAETTAFPRLRLPWRGWRSLAGSLIFARADAVDGTFADDMAMREMITPVSARTEYESARGEYSSLGAPGSSDPAFDAFFTRLEQPLYGYLRRLVPSDEVAVDLAQEAFFRAWKHFAEVRTYDRPDAWLYRVATNLAISYLRRRRSVNFTQLFARATETEGVDAGEEALAFADPHDIEGSFVERDVIAHALRQLPERQRAALLLRAVQGLSCEEIASALGITVTNTRQILSRARERFRTLYEAAQREG